jgi:8-amino-7-oxononanoate synthase
MVRDEPSRRTALLAAAARLREQLTAAGWDTGNSTSQIIPLVIGSSADALALSAKLLEAGLFVPAIRPPSVPEGAARLRISLTAGHSSAMIDQLIAALADRSR